MVSTETTASSGSFVAGSLLGRYALALYDLSAERNVLEETISQVEGLRQLISQSSDFRALLGNKALDIAQSQKAVEAVLSAQQFGNLVKNFVGVIAQNRRLERLDEILQTFQSLVASKRGIVVAEVITASPLNDVQRAQIQARLAEAGYSRISITEQIDKSILGGLVLRVGSRLYDASLKTKISRIHNKMKGAA